MHFFDGFWLNLKGLWLGVRTPRLLVLGLVRFFVVLGLTLVCAGLILAYRQPILNLVWTRPESAYLVWLWYAAAWLLTLLLAAFAAMIAYLAAQVLFCVFIMDSMSKITEQMVTGQVKTRADISFFKQIGHLIRQEIPRAVLPICLAFLIMVLGWFTPLGPFLTLLSSGTAVVFLAWDNTDLLPARRMTPFTVRFRFLRKNMAFHLGFGLWFLVPGLNLLFLSFAPIGATLYHLENKTE